MALNISAARTVFQNELDKLMVEELTSGFMEANAGDVIYNGGNEIKIPSIVMDGLKDYSRTDGYPTGGVTLSYQTVKMTMDRGESFMLDAMDVEETNFLASASTVLGEFQRTKVVPEVDAYRYSKIHELVKAKEAGNVRAETTALTEKTIYKAITKDIASIRDEIGESNELVIIINGKARGLLNANEDFTKMLTQADFAKGEITTKVRTIDDCPIIGVPSARLFTEYDFFKGTEGSGQKEGFKKKSTAKQINYIILPKKAAIAVCKQDAPKIITPELNQRADAWFIGYRKYHDLWIKESNIKAIRISTEA
nr:MAG TPA: major capsid protein [Caudoviricetes sp.]DAP12504.1 MAG TPA: major capsid protein [Caudoviricetes sp.]